MFLTSFFIWLAIINPQDMLINSLGDETVKLPPVKTFYESCAKCHGSEGESFVSELKKLSDIDLYNITEEMMYGPAFLQPGVSDIKAMTSYLKSITNNLPFVLAEPDSDGGYKFVELSEGTSVILSDVELPNIKISELNNELKNSRVTEVILVKLKSRVKFDLEKSRIYPPVKIGSSD